jgi:hypothetical protein
MVCKTPPEALVEQPVVAAAAPAGPVADEEAPASPKAAAKLFTDPVALWAVMGAQAVAELSIAMSCERYYWHIIQKI